MLSLVSGVARIGGTLGDEEIKWVTVDTHETHVWKTFPGEKLWAYWCSWNARLYLSGATTSMSTDSV